MKMGEVIIREFGENCVQDGKVEFDQRLTCLLFS